MNYCRLCGRGMVTSHFHICTDCFAILMWAEAESMLAVYNERPHYNALKSASLQYGDTLIEIDIHVQPMGNMAGTLLCDDEVQE